VLYEALLVQQTYGHTSNIKHVCDMNIKAMQDIRDIEFRDSGSNANTKICFEV